MEHSSDVERVRWRFAIRAHTASDPISTSTNAVTVSREEASTENDIASTSALSPCVKSIFRLFAVVDIRVLKSFHRSAAKCFRISVSSKRPLCFGSLNDQAYTAYACLMFRLHFLCKPSGHDAADLVAVREHGFGTVSVLITYPLASLPTTVNDDVHAHCRFGKIWITNMPYSELSFSSTCFGFDRSSPHAFMTREIITRPTTLSFIHLCPILDLK